MQTVTLAQYYTLLLLQPSKGKAALATLQQLVIGLRPTNRRLLNAATDNLQVLLTVLQQNPTLLQHFTQAVATVIIHADITNILTDSGLITGATFAQQVRQVISHKLIPPYYEPEDANGILTKLFTKKWDYQWVNLIPNKLLAQLITMVNTTVIALPNDVQTELTNAAKIVSYRIASLGLEGEIFKRANKSEHIINAFTQQNTYLLNLVLATPPTTHEALYNLRTSLLQCQQNLRQLESNSITTGTSINQTFLLRRLTQHVNRLKFIISFFDVNKPLHAISISYFLKDAVAYIKTKNSLRKLSSTTLNLLAYRIVDHTKDTGELYITSTRTQYWKIFDFSQQN